VQPTRKSNRKINTHFITDLLSSSLSLKCDHHINIRVISKHTFSLDNLVAKLEATYFMQPSVGSRNRTVDLNSIVVSAAEISSQKTLAEQCNNLLQAIH
jgi:hypothetical protein